MKIVISSGFPYKQANNFVHAEEEGGNLFVSKHLVEWLKDYFIKEDIANFERFVVLHRDHSTIYSSSDPEDKEIIKC